ncbi:MAG: hypothetical protein SOX25_09295 [Eubacteriales bacterium]|nr:hypothetical protein [Eubacteriales bacterium]
MMNLFFKFFPVFPLVFLFLNRCLRQLFVHVAHDFAAVCSASVNAFHQPLSPLPLRCSSLKQPNQQQPFSPHWNHPFAQCSSGNASLASEGRSRQEFPLPDSTLP